MGAVRAVFQSKRSIVCRFVERACIGYTSLRRAQTSRYLDDHKALLSHVQLRGEFLGATVFVLRSSATPFIIETGIVINSLKVTRLPLKVMFMLLGCTAVWCLVFFLPFMLFVSLPKRMFLCSSLRAALVLHWIAALLTSWVA